VWQQPADAETALFLGYARVLTGDSARALVNASTLRPKPGQVAGFGLALRRSALTVSATGTLSGTVREARVTPEQIRLVVDVETVGELDAVAGLEPAPGVPAATIGAEVLLAVDSTRLALIPTSLD
jgi:thiamine transport system ATP-binding protein